MRAAYRADLAFSDPLPHGTVLRERFISGRVLASTELSTVYLGHERWRASDERTVVIKRLSLARSPAGLVRETAIRAFRREIRLLASLCHSQFPRLRAAFRVGDDYFMVMDFIDGISLDKLMDRGPMTLDVALSIVDGLCDALTYLHRRPMPIIHGDIKPSNIILDQAGRVVLIDFGLARPREPAYWTDEAIGTLPYAPPEQRRGEPLDEQSDIYALGVLCRELFGTATTYPFISDALDVATADDPWERYASVRQFQRALHGWPVSTPPTGAHVPHFLLDLWTAAMVLVVVAILGILFLRPIEATWSVPAGIPTPALRVVLPTPTALR